MQGKSLKVFPLDRYVVQRDGDGTVMEIITKETVDRSLLLRVSSHRPRTPTPHEEDGPKFGVTGAGRKGKHSDAELYAHPFRGWCSQVASGV